MSENQSAQFVQVPVKIFGLGLDPFEIALFFALLSHSGKNSEGIFPSWTRLRSMVPMGKERLWKSMLTLKQCNVIIWDRGKTGVSNRYFILGTGCWQQKIIVDKSGGECGQVGGAVLITLPEVVRQTNHPGTPDEPPVVRQTNPNHIQFNHIQLTKKKSGIKNSSEWMQEIKKNIGKAKR